MWIWNTYATISSCTATCELLAAADQASITDFYLYMDASHYERYFDMIRSFNAKSLAVNIQVWALEGGRVYFSDADGPSHFFRGIQNMIAFNDRVSENERFHGFSADLEPYGRGGTSCFHPGIKSSYLDTAHMTGAWKESQAADRQALMRDWIDIHRTAKDVLNEAGLPFAAAFPHWTCDYFGEPLQVCWPTDESPSQRVMDLLMDCVDDYVVMSYDTDPVTAAARVVAEVEHATTLRRCGQGPRVLAAVETTKGVGNKISYGDCTSSKETVFNDIKSICDVLEHHEAFGGVAIHAWAGWNCLPE